MPVLTISKDIILWFEVNQRALPWRENRTAYKTWISEIMLQQTRVQQCISYFNRFMKSLPDVESLAHATEEEVLNLWQGLGYYTRARNLHAAAKKIVHMHGGKIPQEYKTLKPLPGIGEYTTAAILSIAYNKPFAVVDGNVMRVLARLFTLDNPVDTPAGKKAFQALADELIDDKNPGTFNEAIMELGALVCTPQQPNCNKCPLAFKCLSFKESTQVLYPKRVGMKKVTDRNLNYRFIFSKEGVFLKKRNGQDIWKGLYDLPLADLESGSQAHRVYFRKKHKLTHQTLDIVIYGVPLHENIQEPENGCIFVNFDQIAKYPLPKPIEIFFNEKPWLKFKK